MEENAPEESASPSSKGSQKGLTTVIAIIIVILLVAGGVIVYTMNQSKSSQSTAGTGENSSVQQTPSTPTDTPAAMEGENRTEGSNAMAGEKVIEVDGTNFSFSPKTISVKKGTKVTINFKNTGGSHDFVIDEFNVKTAILGSGKSEEVSFVADKAGTFQYYCGVGNHRAMGMWGTLTVTP